MEDSAFFDEEVIADSEDESELLAGVQGDANPRRSSPFSVFTSTNQYKLHTTHSSISNFTAGPSGIAGYSSRLESPEYRKGKDKETDIDTSFTSFGGTYDNFDAIASSIADRAKTRQRPKNTSASTSLDIIELTSEDEDQLNLKPARPRPRPKPKLKGKPAPKEKEQPVNDSIAAAQTSVPQPETAVVVAPPRPRPRPRPRIKRAVPEVPEPIPPFPPTSTPPLPVVTPFSNPTTSQLPPSDPPFPSLGTAYSDNPNTRAPPIEALLDEQPSSPNSLFGDIGEQSKKRKRNLPGGDHEIDQLASSSDRPLRMPYAPIYDSPPRGMPPPTFFAGSSSSSIGRERDSATPPPVREPEVVDLTMLPPTLIPAPKPKPKKAKKKADLSIYDDDFGAGGIVVLDEDNQDDDFNPQEEGGSTKKKKKSKAKLKERATKPKKAKKAVAETTSLGKDKVVEVLLNSRTSSKEKAAGKSDDEGKKKELPAANKDAFKSREFINDSDDELDFMYRIAPADKDTPITSTKITPPAPLPESSISSSTKKLQGQRSPARSLSPLSDLDSVMGDAGPSTTKRIVSGTKRKSIVDSEGEDDDFASSAAIRVKPPASAKKQKTAEPTSTKKSRIEGSKKGKNVVLSDEDQDHREPEEPLAKAKEPSKPSKHAKKVVHDEEGGQQSTPEEIKENVGPQPSKTPTSATSRPNAAPKPSIPSTNSEHKTPIYARYEIAPRKSSVPMSELIRRANSMPGSPFPSTPSAVGASKFKGLSARTPLAYSPMLKSSRSMLSRIAPLHPNRRTPPPPPPPPPPRKKTKKELELEEKWEEEMVESVGGVEAWAVLGDDERRDIRKAKWARELGRWDE